MDSDLILRRRQACIRLFDRAPIKRTLGMTFFYDDEGCAVFQLPFNPDFDHAMGAIHGGVFATLLDNAGWFSVAPHYGQWIVTTEFHVRLLVPVSGLPLRARGVVVRIGGHLAVANMEVHTPDGTLAADGTGSYLVTSVAIDEDGEAPGSLPHPKTTKTFPVQS